MTLVGKERRDELLGLSPVEVRGSVEAFCEIDAKAIRSLIDEGFLKTDQEHHGSPTASAFATFLERWPQCTAHGFVEWPAKPESEVRIEGLECDLDRVPVVARDALREAFGKLSGEFCAAEYFDEADYLYSWWG